MIFRKQFSGGFPVFFFGKKTIANEPGSGKYMPENKRCPRRYYFYLFFKGPVTNAAIFLAFLNEKE
jgi:hypothetical protein